MDKQLTSRLLAIVLIGLSLASAQVMVPVILTGGFPYAYQRKITITNSSGGTVTAYSVSYTFDHAALVSGGKSLASGADVRVYYYNGSVFTELSRSLDLSSSWNSATTKIWFASQASIANSGTDNHYYLYYGRPGVAVPSYEPVNVTSLQRLQVQAYQNIEAMHNTFSSDSSDYWAAGLIYPYAFAADMWYAFVNVPEKFTAAQINNIANKFVAVKNGSGDLPIALNPDATAYVFYSGNDNLHNVVTGDGWAFIPQMVLLAYQKNASLTTFNSLSASLKTALQRVPLSGGLVNTATGNEWVPWGFQDGVKFGGGTNLMGSLLWYSATTAMATLYTAAGDSTNAATFSAYAAAVASGLDAAFWSSGDTMYHASTGTNNNQIDVGGSAYAVYLGLGSHASAVSAYLVTNYATLTWKGYWRQSSANWGRLWPVAPVAGQYDDGFWSVANQWICTAIALTDATAAQTAINDFVGGENMTQEYYNTDHSVQNASQYNLESSTGPYAYAVLNPSQFTSTAAPAVGTYDNYKSIFMTWDNYANVRASPVWSRVLGVWLFNGGYMAQAPQIGGGLTDVKLTRDVALSDGLLAQVDFIIDTSSTSNVPLAGLCVSSLDTGSSSTARGYCAAVGNSDRTKFWILNEQVAWNTGAAFTTTNGVSYRMQVARVGTAISAKIWATASAEPGSFTTTYTQANNLTATGVSLVSSESTIRYKNLIVRKFTTTEPTTAAGSETPTNGRQTP